MTARLPMTIWVRFDAPAIHCWPGAPEHRAYLRDQHRHLFKIKVSTPVDDPDREIEFHDLLDASKEAWRRVTEGHAALPVSRSCEMMAQGMRVELCKRWMDRNFIIEVSEDGECGAIVG